MYSAYQQTGDGTWVGTHRFTLDQAIAACKEWCRYYHCRVAVVPDNVDPDPYFKLVESLA